METKTNSTAEAVPTVLLKIEQIDVDPNQPRRTFEEIEEMADSIRPYGKVFQPIAVRPVGKRYMLIYGERRLKGSQAAGLEYIPANIYNVTEEEAKVMQLIENLQRKDLHPMQQAKGFLNLAHTEKLSIEDIAGRVGKNVYFVRQQLKLNDLIPEWQSIFLRNGIPLGIALQVCILPIELQRHVYDGEVSEEDEKADHPSININTYIFNKYKGNLSEACFDPADAELDVKMGACISCPFNSACGSLFPEDEKKSRCNNIKCFHNKSLLYTQRELDKAKEDPMIIIACDGNLDAADVKKLQADGVEMVTVGYGEDYMYVNRVEKPDWNTFSSSLKARKVPAKAIKEQFANSEKDFLQKNEEFESDLAIGKVKRAFIISDNVNKNGKYAYVQFVPKTSKKDVRKSIKEGEASVELIDNEIQRLKNKEIRAKELDREKIQRKIVKSVEENNGTGRLPKKPTSSDNLLINHLIIEHLPYHLRNELRKIVKFPVLSEALNYEQYKCALRSLSKVQITFLLRRIIIEKCSTNLPNTRGGFAFRIMAESLGIIPIADFEKQQKEIATKRQADNNKCIAILNEQRKEVAKKSKEEKKTKKIPTKSAQSKAA